MIGKAFVERCGFTVYDSDANVVIYRFSGVKMGFLAKPENIRRFDSKTLTVGRSRIRRSSGKF